MYMPFSFIHLISSLLSSTALSALCRRSWLLWNNFLDWPLSFMCLLAMLLTRSRGNPFPFDSRTAHRTRSVDAQIRKGFRSICHGESRRMCQRPCTSVSHPSRDEFPCFFFLFGTFSLVSAFFLCAGPYMATRPPRRGRDRETLIIVRYCRL